MTFKINKNQTHVMLRVKEKKQENSEAATLFFEHELPFTPGQFIMLWIPGVDEKPYTISFHSAHRFAITIEAKGIFSKKAVNLSKGDLVGIRGPFGRGFEIKQGSKATVVAGGLGMAPLATLIESLGRETLFVHGARTKEYILFPERFSIKREFCTDDGSFGHKGFVTDIFEKQIASGRQFDIVYACGPEIMTYNVFKICEKHGIKCQISLERYMRCGFGVCGACVCGRQVVCKDGPVFNCDQLRNYMKDFNTKALLKSGQDVNISQYVSWRSK